MSIMPPSPPATLCHFLLAALPSLGFTLHVSLACRAFLRLNSVVFIPRSPSTSGAIAVIHPLVGYNYSFPGLPVPYLSLRGVTLIQNFPITCTASQGSKRSDALDRHGRYEIAMSTGHFMEPTWRVPLTMANWIRAQSSNFPLLSRYRLFLCIFILDHE